MQQRILSLATGLLLSALAAFAAMSPAHAGNGDFLDPEQAFRLSAQRADAHTLELRFDIEPGYYMYRERFAFEVAQQPGVALGEAVLPAGKVKFDENFGKEVETYRGELTVRLPVSRAGGPFTLAVTSQGCADKGLCYPPLTRELKVDVADAAIVSVLLAAASQEPVAPPASAAPATPAPAGETARIQAALQSGNLIAIGGVFLLAGLLLSFTPCVLPMLPILSSIIVGQGGRVSRGRGFLLSASYSLGMALVYTAFGVVAGLLGEGLAAALQNPWVLGAFAAMLVALSLSMFGFYELQMPGVVQSRVSEASGRLQGGTLAGVFVMGGLSALIVGPCVAAPLAGALVYISQTRDVVIGGLALFALACGMSVPLLLAGLSAGSLLPRAGAWMESVKHVFGVALLAVAIWLVSPVLPAWTVMLAWGSLLLVVAVFLHAFDRLPEGARGMQRLFKGVGVLLALVGAAQFAGVLSGGRDPLQPLAHLARAGSGEAVAATADHLAFRRVGSVEELDAALKAAGGRPAMLDFYADWCVSCKEYERFTFKDPQVRRKLGQAVLLQADVTANSAQDKALLRRFGLFGPPGIMFFDGQGREIEAARVIGYQPGEQFIASLEAAGL
jgi:thiol:disulfide interchange protein DsbD